MTEHEGHKLAIFPGLEFLRYSIPFKPIEVLDNYLKEADKKGHDLAVLVTMGRSLVCGLERKNQSMKRLAERFL